MPFSYDLTPPPSASRTPKEAAESYTFTGVLRAAAIAYNATRQPVLVEAPDDVAFADYFAFWQHVEASLAAEPWKLIASDLRDGGRSRLLVSRQ